MHLCVFRTSRTDDTLVDATELVDQVTGGRRLAGVDVANDNDVQVSLQHTAARSAPPADNTGCEALGTSQMDRGRGTHLLLTHLGKLEVTCNTNRHSSALRAIPNRCT